MHAEKFHRLFDAMPLIAILRGITPQTAHMIDIELELAGISLKCR